MNTAATEEEIRGALEAWERDPHLSETLYPGDPREEAGRCVIGILKWILGIEDKDLECNICGDKVREGDLKDGLCPECYEEQHEKEKNIGQRKFTEEKKEEEEEE